MSEATPAHSEIPESGQTQEFSQAPTADAAPESAPQAPDAPAWDFHLNAPEVPQQHSQQQERVDVRTLARAIELLNHRSQQPQGASYPQVDVDTLLEKPGEVMGSLVNGAVSPIAQQVQELQQRIEHMNQASMVSRYQESVSRAKKNVSLGERYLSKYDAFSNPQVKAETEKVLRAHWAQAEAAARNGDTSSIDSFGNEDLYKWALGIGMMNASYGVSQGPANPGAAVPTGRGSSPNRGQSATVSEGISDVLNRTGRSVDEFSKTAADVAKHYGPDVAETLRRLGVNV